MSIWVQLTVFVVGVDVKSVCAVLFERVGDMFEFVEVEYVKDKFGFDDVVRGLIKDLDGCAVKSVGGFSKVILLLCSLRR